MENKNHLVLFDIGAVLLELDYSAFYNNAAKIANITPEKFKEIYTKSGIENETIRGTMEPAEYLARVKNMIGDSNLSQQRLVEIISTSWKAQVDEIVDIKRKVHEQGYVVGVFSNFSKLAEQVISKKHPQIIETFGGPEIYSQEVNSMKPDAPMYERAQKLGFEQITYIDDNRAYVEKGTEYGWNGILFTPFIDSAEAVRATQKNKSNMAEIKIADSAKSLVSCLNEFGINIK